MSSYGVPEAPDIEKQWRFKWVQKVGMPFLFLIPLLALLGVFGPSIETVSESGEAVALQVSYPTRFRYKTLAAMRIRVTNISAQTAPTVTVRLERNYLSAFSNVAFQPSVTTISDEAYFVQMTDLEAGESRVVDVEMQAERYWEQRGAVAAAVGGLEAAPDVVVALDTFIFP